MNISEEDGDLAVCLEELRDLEGREEISDVRSTACVEFVRCAGAAFGIQLLLTQ